MVGSHLGIHESLYGTVSARETRHGFSWDPMVLDEAFHGIPWAPPMKQVPAVRPMGTYSMKCFLGSLWHS